MITNVSNIADAGSLHLDGVVSLASGGVGGWTLTFAAGSNDGGISVFELNDDGSLTNLFNLDDDGSLDLNALRDISFVESGGNAFLLADGREDQIDVLSIAADSTLTSDSTYLNPDRRKDIHLHRIKFG